MTASRDETQAHDVVAIGGGAPRAPGLGPSRTRTAQRRPEERGRALERRGVVLQRAVTRAVLGILLALSPASPASPAPSADEAAVRCFVLRGDSALRACEDVIGSEALAEVRAEARYNRGVELDRLGRHAEALVEFAEAIRLKADYPAAHANMGVALAKLHRWSEAVRAYRNAIRQRPAYADAHYNLGVALASLRRWEEALGAFREAARLNAADADAQYNMGLVLNTLHRHREALEAYRAAVRVYPGHASAWGNLGMTVYLLGRYREATEAFERARTLVPDYFDMRPVQRNAWEVSRLQRPAPAIPARH